MFKILILKNLHNLSDEETERQIRESTLLRDFLDLNFSDIVPDTKTTWLFAGGAAYADQEALGDSAYVGGKVVIFVKNRRIWLDTTKRMQENGIVRGTS